MAPQVKRELIVLDDFDREAARRIVACQPRTLVLAGGDTPRRVYEYISATDLPWPEMNIFFGDERCVPPDHAESNYGMAFTALLSKVGAHVHRIAGETCDPAQYEGELTEFFKAQAPRFDLVIHGLGEDGHTASLFPGDPALAVTQQFVVRVERPDFSRLSLTLPALSAARTGIFLVTGEEKRWALKQLMEGGPIPASRITAETLLIFADRAAAAYG